MFARDDTVIVHTDHQRRTSDAREVPWIAAWKGRGSMVSPLSCTSSDGKADRFRVPCVLVAGGNMRGAPPNDACVMIDVYEFLSTVYRMGVWEGTAFLYLVGTRLLKSAVPCVGTAIWY